MESGPRNRLARGMEFKACKVATISAFQIVDWHCHPSIIPADFAHSGRMVRRTGP
jgi:hypothetical protein